MIDISYPFVCIQAPTVYAREDVPKGSPEWRRIQQKLSSSLPGAELTGLERVKNPHTWRRFQNCVTEHEEGDWHMDFTRAGSAVKELWHASGATDKLCESKIGLWLCLAAAVCCYYYASDTSFCPVQVRYSPRLQTYNLAKDERRYWGWRACLRLRSIFRSTRLVQPLVEHTCLATEKRG